MIKLPLCIIQLSALICFAPVAFGETSPGPIRAEKLLPTGERYTATVPDTLDLAERGRLAVHGLTSFLNVEAGYAPYGHTYFNGNPAYLSDMPGGPPNWGKIAESLVMARLMCGSVENAEVDAKTFEGMLASHWMIINPAAPTPVSRAMLALMALYQLDPNPELKAIIDKMAQEHITIAQQAEGRAWYYDDVPDERETALGVFGTWLQAFIHGCAIRPLVRWSDHGGDPAYTAFAGKIGSFLLEPKLWRAEAAPKVVVDAEHAQFTGHHHSYTQALMGLLWQAEATNDAKLKTFVREGYEYMRTFGIARIGLFGEGCTTGDMTYLALKLSELGVGDYWDDADGYIRNHLAELQITDGAKLQQAIDTMPAGRGKNDTTTGPYDPTGESNVNIAERNVGVFLSDSTHPTLIPELSFLYTICCTGNCTPAMYAAWDSIVRFKDGTAHVNLLLNRASPWLDIDSYLPYEGRVVIRNKQASTVALRMPGWVNDGAVTCTVNGAAVKPGAIGGRLVFGGLKAGDEIVITFPVVETTEQYTLKWRQTEFWKESTDPGPNWVADEQPKQLTMKFRGNTLVDISPRDEGLGFPLYQRANLSATAAPMKEVERYIAPLLVKW
ncbi:MAG: hypothetical protein JNK74_06250 [Candidatus Hydrogenedentes bacterium]|nr:hypothetical protein [Candidatus Hydrogenedentota bacterium]